jgi:hypothetical protein
MFSYLDEVLLPRVVRSALSPRGACILSSRHFVMICALLGFLSGCICQPIATVVEKIRCACLNNARRPKNAYWLE